MTDLKEHFISLFDTSNRSKTLWYFLFGVVLIVASQLIGTNHNLIGIAARITGVCSLFFTLLHPWKKGRNYAVMAWIFAGAIALMFITIYILSVTGHEKYIDKGWIMFIIFLICLPGIVVGILGAIFND